MTISNAALFKQAHAMTRATIQDGDCYRTTFGACLKAIKDEAKQTANINLFTVIAAIVAMLTAKFSVEHGDIIYRNNASLTTTYHTSKIVKQAIATALPFTAFFALACLFMALFIGGVSAINAMDERNKASFNALYADDSSQTVTADDSLDIMFNDLQVAIDESGVEGITIVYNK